MVVEDEDEDDGAAEGLKHEGDNRSMRVSCAAQPAYV